VVRRDLTNGVSAQARGGAAIVQPLPRFFVGPTGNNETLGDSGARVRAHVALGPFGAMHRRGVGRSTPTDQEGQGENRSHPGPPPVHQANHVRTGGYGPKL
jgi:hypothetical protein